MQQNKLLVIVFFTYVSNTKLWLGESDVENNANKEVGRENQTKTDAGITVLKEEMWLKSSLPSQSHLKNYIVFLVTIISHDSDDGIVDEEPKGQGSQKAEAGQWLEWWSVDGRMYVAQIYVDSPLEGQINHQWNQKEDIDSPCNWNHQ